MISSNAEKFLMGAGLLAWFATGACGQPTNAGASVVWHDAREFSLEGKGWTDTKDFYDRLPARAEGMVSPAVWGLSHDSAGMCVRFQTDATAISARWKLRRANLAMPHMPATGVSGLDLYVRENGKWHWLGNGRPLNQTQEQLLVQGLSPKLREYRLYLPLYNGVDEVKLGVPGNASLATLPPQAKAKKPIVFYGTSIVQGGCAARPGMAYPAILGRRLDWPTINLGFSGSALSEPEVAALLAELNPAVYVLDPLPNMTAQMVAQRLEPFVLSLRKARPLTPIVLVENANFAGLEFVPARREHVRQANARLREVFDHLKKSGQKRLYYFRAGKFLGADGEGTVDGTHPTDLGFLRMAEALEPVVKRAIKASR